MTVEYEPLVFGFADIYTQLTILRGIQYHATHRPRQPYRSLPPWVPRGLRRFDLSGCFIWGLPS